MFKYPKTKNQHKDEQVKESKRNGKTKGKKQQQKFNKINKQKCSQMRNGMGKPMLRVFTCVRVCKN